MQPSILDERSLINPTYILDLTFAPYVTKYIVTHKSHTSYCTQSHFLYFTIFTSCIIQ